jgi:hypothetical protein
MEVKWICWVVNYQKIHIKTPHHRLDLPLVVIIINNLLELAFISKFKKKLRLFFVLSLFSFCFSWNFKIVKNYEFLIKKNKAIFKAKRTEKNVIYILSKIKKKKQKICINTFSFHFFYIFQDCSIICKQVYFLISFKKLFEIYSLSWNNHLDCITLRGKQFVAEIVFAP